MTIRLPGFTLLELLVVVAIIVVLIALLMPAMERAIRESEMAVCGARQRLIVTSGTLYTQDFKRAYAQPRVSRSAHSDVDGEILWLETTSSSYQPDLIGVGNDPDHDLRPLYSPYMPYTAYGCPLAPGITFDPDTNDPGTVIEANYGVLMGWQYVYYDHFSNETGNTVVDQRQAWRGMNRLGDRLGFFDAWNARPVDSSVAVMDRNHSHSADSGRTVYGGQAAHPDDGDLWPFFIWDNLNGLTHTVYGYGYRSTLDVNAALADNSVVRVNDLAKIDGRTAIDPRFDYAPSHADANINIQYKLMFPR